MRYCKRNTSMTQDCHITGTDMCEMLPVFIDTLIPNYTDFRCLSLPTHFFTKHNIHQYWRTTDIGG